MSDTPNNTVDNNNREEVIISEPFIDFTKFPITTRIARRIKQFDVARATLLCNGHKLFDVPAKYINFGEKYIKFIKSQDKLFSIIAYDTFQIEFKNYHSMTLTYNIKFCDSYIINIIDNNDMPNELKLSNGSFVLRYTT